jgi:hypothetical protein
LLFQSDGHPGDAFGCRCTAEPVLPDSLPYPDPPEISDEDWAALGLDGVEASYDF